ncbi:MAG: DNA polymerase/3'-5' exonuclease PolX [Halanaerobiales bacterium]
MPLHNSEVADQFRMMADLLSIKDANEFRIRAYRNAAQIVSNMSDNIEDMVDENQDLTELDGIGEDLAAKIEEIVKEGKMEELEELKEEISPEVAEMLNIAGLGPERVKTIYHELDVLSVEELKHAAEDGMISELSGFGEKTENKILEDIQSREEKGEQRRILISRAEEIAEPLLEYLRGFDKITRADIAGSYRRRKETVGDLDILVCGDNNEEIINYFTNYEDVSKIISSGETKSSIILSDGIQVDLRVVAGESYGSALHYFTGSKEHSVKIRKIGQDQDLKINEYGVFNVEEGEDNEERIGGEEEKDIYESLGFPYIEPELREQRGELEIDDKGDLPDLIKLDDIKGDLQMHTDATDGRDTMADMIEAAIEKEYQYIALTDHSRRVTMAQGLDEDDVKEQIEKIDKMNEKYDDIKILKGIEVDILKDGSLDLEEDILSELDIRVCSIHYNTNLSRDEQTERMIEAIKHPLCNIIAHPTGRIIAKRQGYDINLDKVMEAARKYNTALEINAQPDRLDLADKYVKKAVDMGVNLVISTDAHNVNGLNNIKYGVYQARRGWCEADNVINTRDLEELMSFIRNDE